MAAGSLWAQLTEFTYMSEEGRAERASHGLVTDFLSSRYAGVPFELLDCGVLSGVTYGKLRAAPLEVGYTGIDIGAETVAHCRRLHPEARWEQMSVMDLGFPDDSFDVVHCRHVLECLPYYETAVREVFRVARRHVVICLFQVPREPEVLMRRETPEGYIWLNRYAPGPFEGLLHSLSESVKVVDSATDHKRDRVYFCTKPATA